jgi:hypothetical protein
LMSILTKNFAKAAETRLVPLEVPALRPNQLWSLLDAFRNEGEFHLPIGRRPSTQETDSGPWLSTSEDTSWLPLPPVVERMLQRKDVLRDVAAAIYEVACAVQSCVPNYRALSGGLGEIRRGAPESVREYLQVVHDRWFETMVANLAAFEIAPGIEQLSLTLKVTGILQGVERKPGQFARSFEDLQAFLDLPIWKKRHELYSAWILTQFLAAMYGHDIELHSEDGTLTFGFHATKLATVHSLPQAVTVYGERRVAATNLKGKGRKTGIQPDYTVWDGDLCQMAIECKHYKRPSTSNFSHALEDYASNLPHARVLLGNYGPIPIILKLDTNKRGFSKRQFAWGNLNPDHPEEVSGFRETIRSVFGDPVALGGSQREVEATRVFAFDVSPSMQEALRDAALQKEVEKVMNDLAITHFAAVDDQLRAVEKADIDRIPWLVSQRQSQRTELGPAATILSQTASELYFLTDQQGFNSLGDSKQNMWQYTSHSYHFNTRGLILARVLLQK